jgi:hypothetical protein
VAIGLQIVAGASVALLAGFNTRDHPTVHLLTSVLGQGTQPDQALQHMYNVALSCSLCVPSLDTLYLQLSCIDHAMLVGCLFTETASLCRLYIAHVDPYFASSVKPKLVVMAIIWVAFLIYIPIGLPLAESDYDSVRAFDTRNELSAPQRYRGRW